MDSFAARETKALDGGGLPTPLLWIDGGGQLPYSHVVVDVSGSMHSPLSHAANPYHTNTRMEYVFFLLTTMLATGAITKNTKLYPTGDTHPDPTTRFVSAGMVLEPSASGGPWETYKVPTTNYDTGVGKVFHEIFAPKFATSHMEWVNELPHTKTLLITDVGSENLPPMVGGTWVESPEYKRWKKSLKSSYWTGYGTPNFSGVKGWIENAPFDIIAW